MQDDKKGTQQPDFDREDEFLRDRMERYGQSRQAPFDPFFSSRPRKSKWLAGLLSFMVPGTGQFYLGLMQRGLGIMLLFFLNIFAIVFFATNGADSIPLIVLFSLLVPVIYFYNIFDALQQTDKVNLPGSYDETFMNSGFGSDAPPTRRRSQGNTFGYLLIAAGVVLFLASGKPAWLERAFELLGSSIGAVILIGVGLIMFYKESRKK